eukprot:scaffold28064_cov73-Skeletonema_marinoi.AAC.1
MVHAGSANGRRGSSDLSTFPSCLSCALAYLSLLISSPPENMGVPPLLFNSVMRSGRMRGSL